MSSTPASRRRARSRQWTETLKGIKTALFVAPTTWRHAGGTASLRSRRCAARHLKVWRYGGTARQAVGGTVAARGTLTAWDGLVTGMAVDPGSRNSGSNPAKTSQSGRSSPVLVDAAALAVHLSVDRSYVYEHATELGAIRLGSGPRARLRFDLEDVRRRLSATSCSASRESEAVDPAPTAGLRPRRRRQTGTTAQLLPIRGRTEATA
jgi:hypothetical protein